MSKLIYGHYDRRADEWIDVEMEWGHDQQVGQMRRLYRAAKKKLNKKCPYVNYEDFIADHPDYEVNMHATCPNPFPNLKKALMWVVNPMYMRKRAKFWKQNAIVEVPSYIYDILSHHRGHHNWFIVPQSIIDKEGSYDLRYDIKRSYFEPLEAIMRELFGKDAEINKILDGDDYDAQPLFLPNKTETVAPKPVTWLEIEEELISLENRGK